VAAQDRAVAQSGRIGETAMTKTVLAFAAALAMTAAASQALALNPQPLPPRWISPPTPPHPEPVPHVPVVRF
jgi:hypothetical protein